MQRSCIERDREIKGIMRGGAEEGVLPGGRTRRQPEGWTPYGFRPQAGRYRESGLAHRGAGAYSSETGWPGIASELVGLVGLERNGFFRTQMFEREWVGDEGGQKWSACVRLGSRKFRKIKNLVFPVSVMEKRQTRRRQKHFHLRAERYGGQAGGERIGAVQDAGARQGLPQPGGRYLGVLLASARVGSHLLALRFRRREDAMAGQGGRGPNRTGCRNRPARAPVGTREGAYALRNQPPVRVCSGWLAFARITAGSFWEGEK